MSALDTMKQVDGFVLPVLLFGLPEVHRVARELAALEEYFTQAALRKTIGAAPVPETSRSLQALAAENNRDLVKAADRKLLEVFLQRVVNDAPRVHISFSSDPTAAFTGKMVSWFRRNISPIVLVQVGLQPTIAAGCVLRTSNKMFDFSLRRRFEAQRPLLAAALKSGVSP